MDRRNRLVREKLAGEYPHLRALPPAPVPEYVSYTARVLKWSNQGDLADANTFAKAIIDCCNYRNTTLLQGARLYVVDGTIDLDAVRGKAAYWKKNSMKKAKPAAMRSGRAGGCAKISGASTCFSTG